MIDDTFTPEYGIPVNVQLVQATVLLPATVAGRGPDVALSVGNGEPVNYATRNASMDLTGFEGFEDVIKEFLPNSLVPFRFNGGVYSLPEQQQFQMMFYRTDILEELGVKPPNTWKELYEIIPDIQKKNMDISVPVAVNTDMWGAMQTFSTFLYQKGGRLYVDDDKASGLDTEEAIAAFKEWTDLYLNYGFPLQFDVMNRFRTGEIPIAINEYWLYNNLQVFAPEIRGLWEMAPIPGVEREDGTIDRSTTSGGNCVMMLKNAKDPEAAWQFMKWWVSAETQVRFGREMESLMGASARHPTANIVAAEQLPWPTKDYKALNTQRQWVIGNPEVPGGYFTPRHLNNAFRKVINEGADPRETLLDYVRIINDEIDNKRKEFGLELRDGGK
ncbi:MAG TPA: extracellular solute-binding protein [Candidatus Atribacteria bacterium]|nr:extracellular solute-binding protein [Candidatus Atribacteria bacterium]